MDDWCHEVWSNRVFCHLSRREWADVCTVHPNTIYRWETGKSEPSWYVKERLRIVMADQCAAAETYRRAARH